jgi:hypothetical protein
LNCPHSGQRPSHFGLSALHCWQTKRLLGCDFAIVVPGIVTSLCSVRHAEMAERIAVRLSVERRDFLLLQPAEHIGYSH